MVERLAPGSRQISKRSGKNHGGTHEVGGTVIFMEI